MANEGRFLAMLPAEQAETALGILSEHAVSANAALIGSVSSASAGKVTLRSLLGFPLQKEAELRTLTLDVLKSSEIEGEHLNPDQVRSSIARRLGLDVWRGRACRPAC